MKSKKNDWIETSLIFMTIFGLSALLYWRTHNYYQVQLKNTKLQVLRQVLPLK